MVDADLLVSDTFHTKPREWTRSPETLSTYRTGVTSFRMPIGAVLPRARPSTKPRPTEMQRDGNLFGISQHTILRLLLSNNGPQLKLFRQDLMKTLASPGCWDRFCADKIEPQMRYKRPPSALTLHQVRDMHRYFMVLHRSFFIPIQRPVCRFPLPVTGDCNTCWTIQFTCKNWHFEFVFSY